MSLENNAGAGLSFEKQKLFDKDVADLRAAEVAHGMKGALEGRVRFGLDPAGMMVVGETAPLARKIIESLGSREEQVWPLVKDLHSRGPWAFAERLSKASDPEIQAYIVMAAATRESGAGYDPAAYLNDRSRVIGELGSFQPSDFAARKQSLEQRIDGFEDKTVTVGDRVVKVAMASGDAALALAVQGYEGCVIRFKDMRFAQTDKISDALLVQQGYVRGFGEVFDQAKGGFARVTPETPGARIIWVKKEEAGLPMDQIKPVAKRIAPGYVLLYQDEALALDLVRRSIVEKQ